jgi:hypothetical protein
LPISSVAMWRASSGVSTRDPTDDRRPLTSTIGGLPGEKNRSLTFGALRSIAFNNVGVENGAGAGAGDRAAPVAALLTAFVACGFVIGGTLLEADMDPRTRCGSDYLKRKYGLWSQMTEFDYRGHYDIFKNGQNVSLEIGKAPAHALRLGKCDKRHASLSNAKSTPSRIGRDSPVTSAIRKRPSQERLHQVQIKTMIDGRSPVTTFH